MQIKRRLFSYPVLNSDNELSSYNKKQFLLKFNFKENDKNIIFENIYVECDSEYIKDNIKEERVKATCVVECSNTVFRKKYDLSFEPGKSLTISKDELMGRVEVSSYVYALDDMVLNSTEEFDEDYQNINFEIEKYNFLCVDDGYEFEVIHEQKESNFYKSIFSIIPIEDTDTNIFDVNVKTNKIEIGLSKENHQHYKNVYQSDVLVEEFFCVLLIPSLVEALYKCKEYANENGAGIDDIEMQYNWFRSVTFAYKSLYGNDLTIEEFKSKSAVALAQELLGNPVKSALITIENSQNNAGGEEDE